MAINIAVDVGGTFTDLVGYNDSTGEIYQAKSPTTPRDITLGIFDCLRKCSADIGAVTNLIHGTTTAINTVIEGKGAKTALVVTKGTRDVYHIGRGNRPESYNIYFKRSAPLVPRHMTFELGERVLATGDVLTPIDINQARTVVKEVAQSGAESVAVCLLHAWANPCHEGKIAELLRVAAPGIYLSLSHEILREYGEYERISTTVLNSYIGPKISKYINDLEQLLAGQSFTGRLFVMQSNGGVMSPAVAKQTPVAMLESGPVGGFIGAAHIGRALGLGDVIAFDMGGTTAKTSLIKDGEPQIAHGYYIGGYASGQPMMLPVVDVVEIGAGGGTIAWVDNVGALKLGPESAGADPGPACYGWGGNEPTVTDANLVCGRLSPTAFLGGEMPLDVDRAKRAIESRISSKMGLSVIDAAIAIAKIAVVKMSLAVRGISTERGYDPRDFALLVFGGAGSLHAVEVARELHIPRVVVPNYPAQFSALGMLMADIKHDYVRTYYKPLEGSDFGEIACICNELIEVGSRTLAGESVSCEDMNFDRFLDIRYKGQEFSIPVPIPAEYIDKADTRLIRRVFDELHNRRYGYQAEDQPLEIVNVRLTASGKRKQLAFPKSGAARSESPLVGKRIVYLGIDDREGTECPVYSREKMASGYSLVGPAIIQEYASTTVLFPGDEVTVAETGELMINIGGTGNSDG